MKAILEPFAAELSVAFLAASRLIAARSSGSTSGSAVRSRGFGLVVWPKSPAPATMRAFSTASFHTLAIFFSFRPVGDSSTRRAFPGRSMWGSSPVLGTTTGPPTPLETSGVNP